MRARATRPAVLATLTIEAGAEARRAGSSASVRRTTASKLSSMWRWTFSWPPSAKPPRQEAPALLTSRVSRPPWSLGDVGARPARARRRRSGRRRRRSPGRAASRRARAGGPRGGRRAPARCRARGQGARAVASPMPLEAPVITRRDSALHHIGKPIQISVTADVVPELGILPAPDGRDPRTSRQAARAPAPPRATRARPPRSGATRPPSPRSPATASAPRSPGSARTAPLLAVVGHIDEIGLVVTHIDEKGFLYFAPIGGWDPQILVGQRVEVRGQDGLVPGVVGRKPIHLLEPEQRKKVVELKGLHIDIGAADRDEAERAGPGRRPGGDRRRAGRASPATA